MKRISFLLAFTISFITAFSQHPTGVDSFRLQTMGNIDALVKSKAAIGSDSGFINATYPDTTSANHGKIKNYAGAQIRVDDTIWVRNLSATKWLNMMREGTSSGGSSSGHQLLLNVIGNTSNANGMTLTDDSVLNLEPADRSFGGVITASNTPQYLQGQKSIFSSTDTIFTGYGSEVKRTVLQGNGVQRWWITTVGSVNITAPVASPGIVFLNNADTGRSQIRQYVDTGGISIGSYSGGGAIAGDQLIVLNNGHTFITGNNPIFSANVTDAGYLLDVFGDTRTTGTATVNTIANGTAGVDSVLVESGGLIKKIAPSGAETDAIALAKTITLDQGPDLDGGSSTQALSVNPSFTLGNVVWANGYPTYDARYLSSTSQSHWISGGDITWISGYTYNMSASTYMIDGITYSAPSTNITLAAADPTDDRIDLFVGTTSSTLIAITGTPSTPATEPDFDATTQLQKSFATVLAGSTEPAIVETTIYKENIEWTTAVSAGTINPASLVTPFQGTKDVEGTNVANGTSITFTSPSAPNMGLYTNLIFEIKSKATWSTTKHWTIRFYNGTTAIGNPVNFGQASYGFVSTSTVAYQPITIPLTDFGNISTATVMRITQSNSSGTIGWFLDDIRLQSNTGSTPLITTLITDVTGSGSGTISTTVVGIRNKTVPALSTGNLRYNGSAFVFDNTTYLSSAVTSVAKGYGLVADGTITTTGTITVDSFAIASRPRLVKVADSLGVIIATKGTGTLTSVGVSSTDLSVSGSPITTSGSITLDINSNAVTDTKIRQSAGLSVIGRSANSTGNVADITGTADQVLRVNSAGTALGFGTLANASLTNSSVTYNGVAVALGASGTLTLASSNFANQGTTTTVLHGNASGNPAFNQIAIADLSATGTPSSTTFLRGDNTWGAAGVTTIGTFSNTSTANALDISGSTLTAHAADTTNPGSIIVGTQLLKGAKTIYNSGIGITSTNALTLSNAGAATISLDQWSPSLILHGSAWKQNATAASQTFDWIIQGKNITGTSAISSTLSFDASNNGAAQINGMTLAIGNAATATLTVPNLAATTGVTTPFFANNSSQFWKWGTSAELFQYSGATLAGGNLQLGHNQSIIADQGYTLDAYGEGAFNGGINIRQLAAPSGLSATPLGVAGSTTITYTVVPVLLNGTRGTPTDVTITTANATLSASNYVFIQGAAVPGTSFYDLYRKSTNGTSPTTTGRILTNVLANQLQDKNTVAGAGETPAATNTTGNIGIGVTTVSGALDIRAGVAVANGAPIFLRSGVSAQTTLVAGQVNYDGSNIYLADASRNYTLDKSITGSGTLDFPSTGSGAIADLTITVTGAASGDVVELGVPNGSVTSTASFFAWVSAANTVTVRFSPKATEDPTSGTFSVRVVK